MEETHPTRREFLEQILAVGATSVLPSAASAANGKLATPKDIRGPTIVYITYGGCSNNQTHNFTNIRSIAAKSHVPIYAITLTPTPDRVIGPINYVSNDGQYKNIRAPGIHVFPKDEADAVATARKYGLAVNPSNRSGHSNRLVLLDAQNRIVGTIPSTQPLATIMKTYPAFFTQPGQAIGR